MSTPLFTVHNQLKDDALDHVAFSLDKEDWYDFPSYQPDPLETLLLKEQDDEQD